MENNILFFLNSRPLLEIFLKFWKNSQNIQRGDPWDFFIIGNFFEILKIFGIGIFFSGASPPKNFFLNSLIFQHYARLVRTDKCFVSFSTCNPNACSHWLTQAQKEADIYYSFIIGWHTLYFSSYWLSFIDLTLLHMSRLRWKLVQVEN